MDYIALNHNASQPKGIIYNAGKPLGGVRYYDPRKKSVNTDANGNTQVVVEVNEKEQADDNKLIAERLGELEEQSIELDKKLGIEKQQEEQNEYLDKEESAEGTEDSEKPKRDKYTISVADEDSSFFEEGIKKPKLSREEKDWLLRAQNYFITGKENGVRIGSAEQYTTMEILEALWATAEDAGIDPKRFIVQLFNESRFNPNVVGRSGERGIGQFKQSTAKAYNYDWEKLSGGAKTFAYQAKVAADFVKQVGEHAYNGGGTNNYKDKISLRIDSIQEYSDECVMSNAAFCET